MAVERLLLLSGAIGAGKTSVACALMNRYAFRKVGSSDYLKSLIPPDELKEGDELRLQLQELGDRLDEQTDYLWIVDPVAISTIQKQASVTRWLIDAVRKERQVEHFRQQFGASVRHVHFTAPDALLRARYTGRGISYDQAVDHPNEVNARQLGKIADVLIDTSVLDPHTIANRIVLDLEA
ncbi:AAA family ATPase [Dyella sp. 2HG41-7]|uniref:AAA family ATPase n=1 Tax=Dyella sp. 2HG41-7 TaxID=2883239 RepID=UPI001F314E8D|nr:AAA family ATPase [Dyella sp. 2HG41-7]